MRPLRTLLSVLLAAAVVGCLGPYQMIGEELDPTVPLGDQPTWIQATPEQTTLIVFARPDGGFSAPFSLTTIASDLSTVILTGTYSSTATEVTLNSTLKYTLDYQYDVSVTSRTGAQRFNVDGGATYTTSLDGGILTLTGTPALGSFVAFPQALANLQATTQAEANCVLRVYDLTVISAEARILGFNGPAIIQYTSPANFNGVISGFLGISVQSLFNPNVTQVFQNYSDFSGFVLDGTQYTVTDLNGNGYLSDVVNFQMAGVPPSDGGPTAPGISGQVAYGNAQGSPPSILINGGTPSAGSYQLTLDGGSTFLISYAVLDSIDVTPCVSTPQQ
ncbi:MAG: hypothetical protein ACLQDQ_11165 [Myxococcaceae bacterium]